MIFTDELHLKSMLIYFKCIEILFEPCLYSQMRKAYFFDIFQRKLSLKLNFAYFYFGSLRDRHKALHLHRFFVVGEVLSPNAFASIESGESIPQRDTMKEDKN